MVHITGGGFYDNVNRILPRGVAARFRFGSWPVPPVFDWLREQGNLTWPEMLQIFNCGVGFMPPLALLVGWLRAALNRNHQALLDQYEALTAELRHRTALEERQRDVDHILRHDLKSPLTGLISIPQMLLDDGNLKPEHREMLTLVATAGRKMLGQINSSLELRKIEDGTYTLQAEPCDPVKLVRDNFGMLGQTAGSQVSAFCPSRPAKMARSVRCPLPVEERLPKRCAST